MGHMGTTAAPNGHQTPVVYASCKLQAAAVTQNGVLGPTGSPPLETTQNIHMGHHMQEQHPQHHQQHHQQQHMMYGAQQNPNMHQQAPHQQPPLQGQPQGQPPASNTASALPSPLYPWMRSQFGEFNVLINNIKFILYLGKGNILKSHQNLYLRL